MYLSFELKYMVDLINKMYLCQCNVVICMWDSIFKMRVNEMQKLMAEVNKTKKFKKHCVSN